MPRLRFPVRPEFHTSVRPEPVEGRTTVSQAKYFIPTFLYYYLFLSPSPSFHPSLADKYLFHHRNTRIYMIYYPCYLLQEVFRRDQDKVLCFTAVP